MLRPGLPLPQTQFLTNALVEPSVQKRPLFQKVSPNLFTCLEMCQKHSRAEGAKTTVALWLLIHSQVGPQHPDVSHAASPSGWSPVTFGICPRQHEPAEGRTEK